MPTGFKGLVDCLLDVAVETFGETVTYIPKSGSSYSLTAVFDRSYQQVDPDTQVLIASNIPTLGVNLNQMVATPKQGDRVQIGEELFRIRDSQEDGQGGALLLMQNIDDLDSPDATTDI